MKKKHRAIFYIIIVFGLVCGTGYWLFFKSAGEADIPITLNEATVDFSELNETVYVRAKAWGLGGNHEEIVFSTSPMDKERRAVKGEDFIIYTPEVYYKKQGTDSLIIYAESSAIDTPPENQESKVKIVFMALKNYNEVKEYEKNYLNYGLNKIDVYEE